MLRIILNNLKRRRRLTLVTVVLVAFATCVSFAAIYLSKGLAAGLEASMDRLGADLLLLPKDIGSNVEEILFTSVPMNIYMPAKVLAQARTVPGVAVATPQFFTQTLDETCCSLDQAQRLVGFDQESDFVLKPWLETNLHRPLADHEMITGGKLLTTIGGQEIILDKIFHVAGQLELTGGSLDNTIFIPLQEARSLAAESKYLRNVWKDGLQPDELISAVLIKVAEQHSVFEVAEKLNRLPEVSVVVASQVLLNTKKQMNMLVVLMSIASGIMWLTCLVALGSHFTTIVFERKTEIGLFRALGATKSDIFRLISGEALGATAVGGILGLLLASWAIWLVKSYLVFHINYPFLSITFAQTSFWALVSWLAALLAGLIAALYPAWHSASMDPAGAISQGELE